MQLTSIIAETVDSLSSGSASLELGPSLRFKVGVFIKLSLEEKSTGGEDGRTTVLDRRLRPRPGCSVGVACCCFSRPWFCGRVGNSDIFITVSTATASLQTVVVVF